MGWISLTHKKETFDFVYLFIIVMGFNVAFLLVKYYIFDKPIFDESELSYFNIGTFISFVFVIPILEEFCFRGIFMLPKSNFYIYPTLISIILFICIFMKFDIKSYILICSMITIGTVYLISTTARHKIHFIIENHTVLLIVLSAIIFAVIHITNYDTRDLETYLKLVPRLTGGLYLGYIAYKYGIGKSYMMHTINNFIPFIYLGVMRWVLH